MNLINTNYKVANYFLKPFFYDKTSIIPTQRNNFYFTKLLQYYNNLEAFYTL